jgi:competence protein ComEC
MRATLMLALFLGARLLYRERSILNAVGAAALGLLALDPRAVFDASFQLTFICVLVIAGIAVPLMRRTSEKVRRALRNLDSTAYDFALPPRMVQFRLDLRLQCGRLGQLIGKRLSSGLVLGGTRVVLGIFDLVLLSALMQIALALPMAAYFHRATVLSLGVNLVVVPLATVLMPIAVVALALSYFWLPLASAVAPLAAICLDGITRTVGSMGGLRVADVRVPGASPVAAGFAVLAFVFALLVARRRPLLSASGLVMLAVSAICLLLLPPKPQLRPGVLEVTAIDVGQGDSTLVVSPQGRTLLVDAGGPLGGSRSEFDYGEEVVSTYLWSRGIAHLDAVAITHGDSDHIGGMHSVLANFRPRELWLGPSPDIPALRALQEQAAAQGVEIVHRAGGDGFDFGGVGVNVLSPPANWHPAVRPRNNESLVMRLSFRGTAAILPGDVEKKMERSVAALQPSAAR